MSALAIIIPAACPSRTRSSGGVGREVAARHAANPCSAACKPTNNSTAAAAAVLACRYVEAASATPGSSRNKAPNSRISTPARSVSGTARSQRGQCCRPGARPSRGRRFHAAAVSPGELRGGTVRLEEDGGGAPWVTCRLPVRSERGGTAGATPRCCPANIAATLPVLAAGHAWTGAGYTGACDVFSAPAVARWSRLDAKETQHGSVHHRQAHPES